MITLLTAPEALTSPATACRYMVEIASIATEPDAQGVAVPVSTSVLDVLVAEPSLSAISKFLTSKGLLEDFEIMRYWVPEDGCDCF